MDETSDAQTRLRKWSQTSPLIDPQNAQQLELLGQMKKASGRDGRVSMKHFLSRLPGLKKHIHAGASLEMLAFGVPKVNFPNGLPEKFKALELTDADLEEYELAGAGQGRVDTSSLYVLDSDQAQTLADLGPRPRVRKFFL